MSKRTAILLAFCMAGAFGRARAEVDPALQYSSYLGLGGDARVTGMARDGEGNLFLAGSSLTAGTRRYNLVLAVDQSGSVGSGTQFAQTKDALKNLIDAYAAQSETLSISMLTFNNAATVILPPTTDVAYAKSVIDALPVPRERTNYADALTVSETLIDDVLIAYPDSKPIYYFISDGSPTNQSNDPRPAGCSTEASRTPPFCHPEWPGFLIERDVLAQSVGVTQSVNYSQLDWIDNAAQGPVTLNNFEGLTDALEATAPSIDAFVLKLTPAADAVLYRTWFGGRGVENAYGLAVDESGRAWVVGRTDSVDFPVRAPIQSSAQSASPSGFVARLDVDGALEFSSYFGSSGADAVHAVSLSPNGDAVIAGEVGSGDYPGSLNEFAGGATDGFVARLQGNLLLGTRAFGGSGDDRISAAAIGASGATLLLAGSSNSLDLPVPGGAQSALAGGNDAFLAAVDDTGTVLWASYLGGSGKDAATAVTVGASGEIYLAGETESADFPFSIAAGPAEARDAFLTRFSAAGARAWSRRFGGALDDRPAALAFDGNGGLLMAGQTLSEDLPGLRPDAVIDSGSGDAYVSRFAASDGQLQWTRVLGGTDGVDAAYAVLPAADGSVWFAGESTASDFPLVAELDDQRSEGGNGFLARFEDNEDFGDAPASYPTLLADNGARHRVGELRLGATVTAEADAASQADAQGDGGDDGIALETLIIGGDAELSATVNGADVSASLEAWVDFDADGRWDDAAERVLSADVTDGDNPLRFAVPAMAVEGPSFARFRLASVAVGSVTGAAADGEVEDYAVELRRAQLSIADADGVEGDAGEQSLRFVLSLSDPLLEALTVTATLGDETALAGSDYRDTAPIATFAPGDTEAVIEVPILGDTDYEGDERFFVDIIADTLVTITRGRATGRIVNDDEAKPGKLQFEADHYSLDENGGSLQLTVTRTGGADGAASVRYETADGSATAGQDYESASGLLEWEDHDTRARTISLRVLDDEAYEQDETFSLMLFEADGAALGDPLVAAITVHSEDAPKPGRIEFANPVYEIGEAAGAVTLQVRRLDGSDLPRRLRWQTVALSASADADYADVQGELAWADGEDGPRVITVPVLDDAIYEGDEVFVVQLTDLDDGTSLGTASVTIHSDDALPVASLSVIGSPFSEDGGEAHVQLHLDHSSSETVTVDLAFDGEARAETDYGISTRRLDLPPGTTSATLRLSGIADTIDEPDETLRISIQTIEGATAGAPVEAVLLDANPTPRLSFTSTHGEHAEGSTNTLSVVLSAASSRAVSVGYILGGSATVEDYRLGPSPIRFAPGETHASLALDIVDDAITEGAETLEITLGEAVGAELGEASRYVVTIPASDPVGIVAWTDERFSVGESAGSATLRLRRTDGSNGVLTVHVRSVDGSAVAGEDYVAVDELVRWADGDHADKTLAVELIGDALYEGQESLVLDISAEDDAIVGEPATAVLTIVDDDPKPLGTTTASASGGSFGGPAVLVLGLLALLRRRRSLCLLAAILAAPAQAACPVGVFAGAEAGRAISLVGGDALNDDLARKGYALQAQVDGKDDSWRVYGGCVIDEHLELGLGLGHAGDAHASLSGLEPDDLQALLQDTADALEGYGDELLLLTRYRAQLLPRLWLRPQAAVSYWRSDIEVRSGDVRFEDKRDGIGLEIGLRLAWRLSPQFELGAGIDFRRASAESALHRQFVSLEYRWGRTQD